jgi:hypothetical protein
MAYGSQGRDFFKDLEIRDMVFGIFAAKLP